MFRYFIFEKIFPATVAEIPVGLPEDNAAVACVTAEAAFWPFSVASIIDFVMLEVGESTHCL